MNIETKTVKGDISDYLKFGWKHTEDTSVRGSRGLHHTEHVLARDKDMNNYSALVALESKYFSYKRSLRQYEPMDGGIVFILFLLGIIPGLVYTIYKSKQFDSIETDNNYLKRKMNEILAQRAKLR